MAQGRTIAAVVIARDEAARLGPCLASLVGVDALLVVDHGSTDNTAQIAERAGARVLTAPATLKGLGALRAWGEAQIEGAWILSLDADERLAKGGVERLRAAMAAHPEAGAFSLRFKNHLGTRWLRWGGYWPARRPRLLRRGAAWWPKDAWVHERPQTRARIVALDEDITHLTFRSLAHARAKQRRYARWGAAEARALGRRSNPLRGAVRALWRFIRSLVLRGGWLMGRDGWGLALIEAEGVWYRHWLIFSVGDVAVDPPNLEH